MYIVINKKDGSIAQNLKLAGVIEIVGPTMDDATYYGLGELQIGEYVQYENFVIARVFGSPTIDELKQR